MNEYLTFVVNHWELWLAFTVILGTLIGLEIRIAMSGIPRLSPQQATDKINREHAVIIDLRDSAAFEKGHITDAINIPFEKAKQNITSLGKYKSNPLILIGQNAQQSVIIANLLRKNQFDNPCILKDGMAAWHNASLPVIK